MGIRGSQPVSSDILLLFPTRKLVSFFLSLMGSTSMRIKMLPDISFKRKSRTSLRAINFPVQTLKTSPRRPFLSRSTYALTTSRTSQKSRRRSRSPTFRMGAQSPFSISATWRAQSEQTKSSVWPGPVWGKGRAMTMSTFSIFS